jgi:hypothetical protein
MCRAGPLCLLSFKVLRGREEECNHHVAHYTVK